MPAPVMTLTSVTLCADDYSLSPAINTAVLRLFEQGQLSATSCMTQSPTWRADAQQLQPWRGRVDIGLHINFTHPFAGAYHHSLPQWMLRSALHALPRAKLHDSLCQQLDAFEDAMGMAPDFIDGHQHVHIFSPLRELLLSEYQRRYGQQTPAPWLRNIAQLTLDGDPFKARVLQAFGAKKLQQQLRQHGIPHNEKFAGLYELQPDSGFAQRLPLWLQSVGHGGVVMCHPAAYADNSDSISAARVEEFSYLSSAAFTAALTQGGLQLGRLKTTH